MSAGEQFQEMPTMDGGASFKKYFTIESANRSLVLVRRIVTEIVAGYRELMERRDALEAMQRRLRDEETEERLAELQRCADRLNQLHAELVEIGCHLKDWQSGLIDFPARHEGRDVLLCWRIGEESVSHWHELDAGFRGRQAITPEFAALTVSSQ
ncbi:MAG: DUF2203 domain-containing protein [Phycisphaerae bacterium]|nr:DUF2203 domain-containing protein [Phycisphaerae bacterium]